MKDFMLSKNAEGEMDISIKDGDFVLADNFINQIIISLFSWAHCKDDDVLDDSNIKMGWWGDAVSENENMPDDPIGSRLWLLQRAKLSEQNILKFKDYAQEALSWIDDEDDIENWTFEPIRVANDPDRLDAIFTFYFKDKSMMTKKLSDLAMEVNYGS